MDLTYLIALVLSLIVGFVGSLVFVAMRGRSYWKLRVSTLLVAFIADWALLIDWRRVDQFTTELLLLDTAFFAAYGLIGTVIGVLPVLGLRRIYRVAKAREESRYS